ncbi:MAG: hypothetical protein ACREQM_06575 [Candidatus Dormibacteraceae bacterium]
MLQLDAAQKKVADSQAAFNSAQSSLKAGPSPAVAAWQKLQDAVKGAEQQLAALAQGPATNILNWMTSLVPKAEQAGESIEKWFGQNLPKAMPMATDAVNKLFKAMGDLGNIFKQAFDYVIDHRQQFEKLFQEIISFIIPAVQGFVKNLEKLAAWWFANWPKMAPVVSAVFTVMGSIIQAFIDTLQFFVLIIEGTVSADETAVHAVGKAWQWLSTTATTVWNDITSTIGGAASAIGTTVSNAFNGMASTAESGLNAVIGVVNSFIDDIDQSPLGSLGINIPNVNYIEAAQAAARASGSPRAASCQAVSAVEIVSLLVSRRVRACSR